MGTTAPKLIRCLYLLPFLILSDQAYPQDDAAFEAPAAMEWLTAEAVGEAIFNRVWVETIEGHLDGTGSGTNLGPLHSAVLCTAASHWEDSHTVAASLRTLSKKPNFLAHLLPGLKHATFAVQPAEPVLAGGGQERRALVAIEWKRLAAVIRVVSLQAKVNKRQFTAFLRRDGWGWRVSMRAEGSDEAIWQSPVSFASEFNEQSLRALVESMGIRCGAEVSLPVETCPQRADLADLLPISG